MYDKKILLLLNAINNILIEKIDEKCSGEGYRNYFNKRLNTEYKIFQNKSNFEIEFWVKERKNLARCYDRKIPLHYNSDWIIFEIHIAKNSKEHIPEDEYKNLFLKCLYNAAYPADGKLVNILKGYRRHHISNIIDEDSKIFVPVSDNPSYYEWLRFVFTDTTEYRITETLTKVLKYIRS